MMHAIRLSSFFLVLLLAVIVAELPTKPVVTISTGKLHGKIQYALNSGKPVYTFLGVPYATPPVGRFRFLPPQPLRQWDGIRSAHEFGNHCPQVTEQTDRVYAYLPLPHHNTSEDCLYLNVYSPALSAKRPVLVWIHGGSNKCGSGSQYDGTALATFQDLIVVTINYRLGALGWLSTLDDNMPGNAGLWDQRAALTWIQRNIAQFGGDPRQVTLAGQSAGGMCVSVHITSGASIGLFRRAISLSGSAMMLPKLHADPLQDTQLLAQKLDCTSTNIMKMVDCLRTKSTDEIVAASAPLSLLYRAIVDGDMLSNLPPILYRRKDYNLVDYMVGLDHDEGYLLTTLFGNLSRDSIDYAAVKRHVQSLLQYYMDEKTDLLAQTIMDLYVGFEKDQSEESLMRKASLLTGHVINSAPIVRAAQMHSVHVRNTFMFVFKHRPSYSEKPAWVISDHGDELPFLFGSMFTHGSGSNYHYSNDDVAVSEMMMSYIANFVKTGNPSAATLPEWPPFTPKEQYLLVSTNGTAVADRYEQELMNFWNHKFTSFIAPPSHSTSVHEEL